MTAPIWMAAPPELHSALLSSGPGPAGLLAAAGAWDSLSAAYTAAATELTAELAAVQAGAWQGPTAARYVSAHLPFLDWLLHAGADSAAIATQHHAAASAYTAALAAMPTLAELAANHTVHAVLVATNFFGINTIPIALNETDYARMWIQAATTMATYQTLTTTAMTSTPPTPTPPPIMAAAAQAGSDGHEHGGHVSDTPLSRLAAQILRDITGGQIDWDPAHGTLNGLPFDAYSNPGQPLYWVARGLELSVDFQQLLIDLAQDPAAALQFLGYLVLVDWPTHIAQITTWLAQSPALLMTALGGAVANLSALSGFAGLSGLAAVDPAGNTGLAPLPAGAPPALPVAGLSPGVVTPAGAPAPAPAAATGTLAGSAPPSAPATPGASAWTFPYAIGGGPGVGFGSGAGAAAGTTAAAKKKAPASDGAVTAANRDQLRARRRRRSAAGAIDHGDEFMDMEAGPVASERGAGATGFAGTAVIRGQVTAAGLATLRGEFGGGPRLPMVPETWPVECLEGECRDAAC